MATISKNSRVGREKQAAEVFGIHPKHHYGVGFGYSTKRDRKRANIRSGKGQTSGKTKGLNCQATAKERYMAKHSRSYKHPDYGSWLAATRIGPAGRS